MSEIDCILVTKEGFIFHSLPLEDLKDAREMVNHKPKGANVIFTITAKERDYNVADILMMYSCGPDQDEDGR